MTPAEEVLAMHVPRPGSINPADTWCDGCVDYTDWPCDAVEIANLLQETQERVTRLESLLGEDHVGRTFHALDGHKRPYGYQQKSEPPDGGTERSDHCRMDARFFLRALLASTSAPEEL